MNVRIPDPVHGWLKMVIETCDALIREEMPWRGTRADPELLASMLALAMQGYTADHLRDWLRASDEWKARQTPQTPVPGDPTPGPAPTPVPGGVVVPTGIVGAENHVLKDARGPHLFVGASLFWALWAEQNGQGARLRENLAFLSERGVDYVRIFASVGGKTWEDREIDETRGDFVPMLKSFLRDVRNTYGMRTQITILAGSPKADTPNRRRALVEKIRDVASAQPEDIFAIEVANESFNNGPDADEARALARVLARTPNLVAVSAPHGDSDAEIEKLYDGVGSLVTLHLSRIEGSDGHWRSVRQPWRESHFTVAGHKAFSNNEPKGPNSSVSADADPTRLAMTAAVSWLCGMGAYLFHGDAGIRGGGKADRDRGRASDYSKVQNADATLKAIAYARSILPPTLPNWSKRNGHWQDAPMIFRGSFDRDILRQYWAVEGGRFVGAAIHLKTANGAAYEAKAPCVVEVHDLVRRAKTRSMQLAKGERFTLGNDPAGAILIGRNV